MKEDKPLVLIVDDNTTNIDLLVNTLNKEYRLGIAKNGFRALDYVKKQLPDLILLDVMMPEMNGYQVCSHLKANPRSKEIPIIFITAMSDTENITKGFSVGAVDYITKPFHAAEVKARVNTHLSIKKMREELNNQNIVLERKVEEKTIQIRQMLEATIQATVLTAETRDPYTAGHQQRVSKYACIIAEKMQMTSDEIQSIRFAGTLHDIGKIRVPVSILNRPGKLLKEEFDLIKTHSNVGYDIVKDIPTPWKLGQIVLQHHERLDGSGYPNGIKADEILPETKIISVIDVIEAMSSHRPYRAALGITIALEEIQKNRGLKYDASVVDVCLEYFTEHPELV
ncbi:MAG: response regulator [Desulfobacterales bacterium]|nr:response regulator [Desulfobacterales bacterium]